MSWLNTFRLGAALPTLALASWLGTAPGLAAATPAESTATAADPAMVANLFDIFQTVNDGLQLLEDVMQGGQAPNAAPMPQSPGSGMSVRTEIRQPQLEQNQQRTQQRIEERQRRLAEDAAQREAHRQQREAYLQSLSPEERQAFLESEREQNNAMWGLMLEGWAAMEEAEANAPSRTNHRQGMSDSEWACYIDPSCGR